MKKPLKIILVSIAFFVFQNISLSQITEKTFGLGLSFGTALAQTDVGGSIFKPISRIFTRYYPTSSFGFEAGFGFGMLEGKKFGFFMSKIIPFDFRLIVSPISTGRLRPYAFSGISIMNFNPIDENEKPLPRNARGEYTHWMGVIPLGASLQYYITRNSIVELTATYNVGTKDYLDDWKYNDNNDGYLFIGINVMAIFESGDADPDKDGLKNRDEKKFGTDPYNPDTDGDGLKDGEEVFIYNTNPLDKDTDHDRLNDYEEIFVYRTNPLNPDTDGDGLFDGEEILTTKTDPLNPDTDGDGLKDGDEVKKYKTDPTLKDTDGDKLFDGEEVLRYLTNPLIIDTDGDGLTDGEEVITYLTNPLAMDTDKGGVPDGVEVSKGKDPNDPKDDITFIPDVGQKIILRGVNFEFNSAKLLPQSKDTLDVVVAGLIANPEIHIEISGHTDNIGTVAANKKLSLARAESVKSYLVSKGINPDRIKTVGYGFERPIADNKTSEGRAKNRRIEFLRIK